MTRTICRHKPSHGHTVAECIMAFAILLPVAALVSKIGLQTQQSLRDSLLTAQAKSDLVNAREVIGTWEFDDVTVANVQSLPHAEISEVTESQREWLAVIEEVQEPIAAKRVSLSLLWTPPRSTAANEVGPLTFWVVKP